MIKKRFITRFGIIKKTIESNRPTPPSRGETYRFAAGITGLITDF